MQTITVSERLRLVPLKISDADELFSLTEANRSYLQKWLPWLEAEFKNIGLTVQSVYSRRAIADWT